MFRLISALIIMLLLLNTHADDTKLHEAEAEHPILTADIIEIIPPCVVSDISGEAYFSLPEVGFIDLETKQLIKEDYYYFIAPGARLRIKCSDGDILEFNPAPESRTVIFKNEQNI